MTDVSLNLCEVEMQVIKNPDKDFVKELKRRIKANNGYCPNQLDRNPDTKCPCKYHEDTGECICGLWIRVPVSSGE